MPQLLTYGVVTLVAAFVFLGGLYYILLPRIQARLSLSRLMYRIVMALRRKPAKPVSNKRIWYIRVEGLITLCVGLLWLTQLHPQIRLLREPLYEPAVHQWHAEQPDNSPEEADILRRLNDVTERMMESEEAFGVSAGLCAGVVYRDKTYILRAGRKRLSTTESPDADSIFEIGSITKVFTGAALASLVEEGVVTHDDPVSALLPGWRVPDYQGRVITLKDLITHRSGLPRMPDGFEKQALLDLVLMRLVKDPYRWRTPETVREFLAGYELPRAPGSVDEYSNLGVGLLGYALAQKTGQSYEELIVRRICEPLGMRNTRITMTPEMTAHDVQGYIGPLKWKRLHLIYPMNHWTMTEAYQGCGGLRSSVHDMLTFVKANLQAPEGPLGKVLARVQTPLAETSEVENCKTGYALMARSIDGLKGPMYWHNGGTAGYCSIMAFCREQQAGVVMLASGVLQEKLAREILNELAK